MPSLFALKEQNSSSLYRLMYGLFYPAVLGAIFYEVLPHILDFQGIGFVKELLAILIVIHFSIDYATVGGAKEYGLLPFICDLLVICALYFAFSQVHISHSEGVSIVGVSLGLAAVYCAFLFFLFSMRRVLSHKILFLIVESLGMLWFLAVAWWWPNAWMLVAGLALFSVIVGYTANKAVQRIAEKSGSR